MTRMRKKTGRRWMALLLSLCMLFTVCGGFPFTVSAEGETDTGLCAHHTEHTTECGYQEAVAGSPCTHVHNEDCGYIEAVEAVPCGHSEHDGNCGYVPGTEELSAIRIAQI